MLNKIYAITKKQYANAGLEAVSTKTLSFTDMIKVGQSYAPISVENAVEFRAAAIRLKLNSKTDLIATPLCDTVKKQLANMLAFSLSQSDPDNAVMGLNQECIDRVSDSNVTYEWLVFFGIRLSLALTNKAHRAVHARNNFNGKEVDTLLTHWESYEMLEKNMQGTEIQKNILQFPDVCFFTTTSGDMDVDDIVDMCLTTTTSYNPAVWLCGLVKEPIVADDRNMAPIHFFWHDFDVHFSNINMTRDRLEIGVEKIEQIKAAQESFNTSASKEDQEILTFILFIALHESYNAALMLMKLGTTKEIDIFAPTINKIVTDPKLTDSRWYESICPNNFTIENVNKVFKNFITEHMPL